MTTEPPFDPAQMAHELAELIAGMQEGIRPLDEAAMGYRARLEAEGWAPAAAELMALEFHRGLMMRLFRPGGEQKIKYEGK